MSLARPSIVGDKNPNWRNAGIHRCIGCGVEFKNYHKDRKYCSKPCHVKHRVVTPETRAAFSVAAKKNGASHRKGTGKGRRGVCKVCGVEFYYPSRRLYCKSHQAIARTQGIRAGNATKSARVKYRDCQQCGTPFPAGQRSVRKFCTYTCFVASGGPIRAGLEAKRMTSIYGSKKDANHTDIVAVIKKLRIPFIDMSALGCGVPDLVVQVHGRLELWEIKNKKTSYGKRGLNKNQKAWAAQWTGNPVVLIHSVDDVLIRAARVPGADGG